MRVLITGVCGYVGTGIAQHLLEALDEPQILGIDNLSRRGTDINMRMLQDLGVQFIHGDIRLSSDVISLPAVDWVIDCAANPTVTAGVPGLSGISSRQLVQHNLQGTINILEFCREHTAGLVLLSTSRVYSIENLIKISLKESETRLEPIVPVYPEIKGFSEKGIAENFSTRAPISLYGATKLASEALALEYSTLYKFPVWINRCGVIGGPRQLGKLDQGIFSYWVYSFFMEQPLKYIGFGGTGKQVRDCVLAEDVAKLVMSQIKNPSRHAPKIINIGGGQQGALSLCEMTKLCVDFFGRSPEISCDPDTRPYDIPYYVTDNRKAKQYWDWSPSQDGSEIVIAICTWAKSHQELVKQIL